MRENLIGTKFGKYLVVRRSSRKSRNALWTCKCDCGKVSDVLGYNLKSGRSTQCRSCGNIQRGDSSGLDISKLNWNKSSRTCSRCKETKLLKEWSVVRAKTGRIYAEMCKECKRILLRLDRARFPEKYRKAEKNKYIAQCATGTRLAYTLRKHYNLTLLKYRDLLALQKNKCPICDKIGGKGARQRLYVDHCHKTLRVRGLLCMSCNTGLGYFKDSSHLLRKARRYLINSKC